ncbi:MAG: cyclic nucleotide-binding domain-containing protein [Geminicoccaceae bacterium]|nr:cyclic nucleotide-binding domain-containing protein [Geminicoccaceae bacterium]
MQTMPGDLLERIAALPERTVEAGDLVLRAGGATGQLMFLKRGALDVEIEDEHLVRVAEPGAVIGDIAFLLNRPHTADVRAASRSVLYVADDPEAFLKSEPEVMLYVARVLAERLNAVNHLLIESRKRTGRGSEQDLLLLETLSRVRRAISAPPPGAED